MAQRDWVEKDYYKVLGVSSTASKDDIKKAYRKLAQKYHPDANKDDSSAEARFKEISEAHAILSNDEKRKEYDHVRQFVESGGQRFYGFGPNQGGRNVRINVGDLFGDDGDGGGLFEDLLGGMGFRNRKGQDVETEAELSFEDAVHGATVTLSSGTKVRIPPGVADGARIKVRGRGGAGGRGAPPGDLYVRVRVRPHGLFSQGRNGDIIVTVPVTFPEAALGAKVEVPTLDGSVTVKIPAGTQSGKMLRVRGKGGPRPRGGAGDLLARIEVLVPQKLSKKEKEALEHFDEVHRATPRAHFAKNVEGNAGSRKVS